MAEARKLGFDRIVLPKGSADRMTAAEREGVELLPVTRLEDALGLLFE